MTSSTHTTVTNNSAPKNPAVGALLGFFFGPLGLLYSSYLGAGVMFCGYVISALCIPLFGIGLFMLFGCTVTSAIWGYMACKKKNEAAAPPMFHNVSKVA